MISGSGATRWMGLLAGSMALTIMGAISNAGDAEGKAQIDDETARAELALLDEVEELRRRENLPPLVRDFAIGSVARDYSRAMASAGDVRHELRGSLSERIRPVAPESCTFGENLARHVDVTAILPGWLESAGHRRNLLNREFDRSGMGVVRGSDGMLYITHLFAGPCKEIREGR